MKKQKLELPQLPKMQCDHGCSDCCGIVLCSDAEYAGVVRLANSKGVTPMKQGVTCPFFQNGGCQVYEARPLICQFFGHSPQLKCSHGHNTNVSGYVESKYRDAMMSKGGHERMLHEAAGFTAEQMIAIVTTFGVSRLEAAHA